MADATPAAVKAAAPSTLSTALKASINKEATELQTSTWAWAKTHASILITFVLGVIVGACFFH